MATVSTEVFKSMVSTCPDGYPKAVSAASIVYTVEKVYLSEAPVACGENPPEYKMLLKILDPNLGVLWIDETVESFQAKVAQAYTSGDATGSEKYVIGVDVPAGSVLTPLDSNGQPLLNKKIHYVGLDGIEQYSPTAYSYNPATGVFTFVTPTVDDSILSIIWNNNA